MKTSIFLLCLLASSFTCQRLPTESSLGKNCRQLVVVTSQDEAATRGKLRCFQRTSAGWETVHPSISVTLGRSGMAWGKGLHEAMRGKQKKEGDGKSPAGIFTFGKAFGYASPLQTPPFKLPYVQSDASLECVDDAQSVYYNLLVDNHLVTKDWQSSEFMRRSDHQYEWGIFVEHNTPAQAGAGSCIFFHVWKSPETPTSGCTAMSSADLLWLMGWLDPAAQPLLVQATERNYAVLQGRHGFPTLGTE